MQGICVLACALQALDDFLAQDVLSHEKITQNSLVMNHNKRELDATHESIHNNTDALTSNTISNLNLDTT